MNGLVKFFELLLKSGPWALVTLFVLVWLAGDYGYIKSVARGNADAIKILTESSDKAQTKSQQTLERIADILEEQRTIQARTGLLACIKEAKSDIDRTECIKRYPIQSNGRGK